jgi:hypothetical protein
MELGSAFTSSVEDMQQEAALCVICTPFGAPVDPEVNMTMRDRLPLRFIRLGRSEITHCTLGHFLKVQAIFHRRLRSLCLQRR